MRIRCEGLFPPKPGEVGAFRCRGEAPHYVEGRNLCGSCWRVREEALRQLEAAAHGPAAAVQGPIEAAPA